MKKHLFAIGALFICTVAGAQVIPNGSFENWTSQAGGIYQDPTGWGTYNFASITGTAPATATKVAGINSGTFAVKLETAIEDFNNDSEDDTLLGTTFLGDLNFLAGTFVDGAAFTARPDSLIAWYKYAPATGDDMGIRLTLSKWNPATQTRDEIATAEYIDPMAVTNYTRKAIALVYSSTLIPDTLSLALSASTITPQDGSTLWVDEVSFVTNSTAGLSPKQETPVLIYPNPAKESVNITLAKDASIIIYNALGMQIDTMKATAGKTLTISTAKFDNGVYLLKTDSGSMQRFVVKH